MSFISLSVFAPVYLIDCTLEVRIRYSALCLTEHQLKGNPPYFFCYNPNGKQVYNYLFGRECEMIDFEDKRQFCIVDMDFILNRVSTEV